MNAIKLFSIAWAVTFLASCKQDVRIAAKSMTITAHDGFQLQGYELLDARKSKPKDQPRALFFYIPGSDYESALKKSGMLASVVILGARAAMIEKRGCSPDTILLETAYRYSDKATRVADCLAALEVFLSDIASDIPVILIGGSEGGDIASVVASKHKRVTHLLLISSGGGMSPKEELRLLVRSKTRALGFETVSELDSMLTIVERSNDLNKLWLGHPIRRWQSHLNDSALNYLVDVSVPTLIIHGEADASVPVQSSRNLMKSLTALGKTNFEYIEYENLDHSLYNVIDRKSWYPVLEIDIIKWLQRQGVVSKTEAELFINRVRSNHKEIF